MGKAKRRILHKSNTSLYLTRESAVNEVFSILKKTNHQKEQAEGLVTLFGLTALELSEAGVSYENLRALEPFVD